MVVGDDVAFLACGVRRIAVGEDRSCKRDENGDETERAHVMFRVLKLRFSGFGHECGLDRERAFQRGLASPNTTGF
jgi:hypothetical protein